MNVNIYLSIFKSIIYKQYLKKKKKLFIALLFFTTAQNEAFAYLDPGTGSIILQTILGAIAAGTSFVAIYWQKVKNFFKTKFKKQEKKH